MCSYFGTPKNKYNLLESIIETPEILGRDSPLSLTHRTIVVYLGKIGTGPKFARSLAFAFSHDGQVVARALR